jgi:hypothetical protein
MPWLLTLCTMFGPSKYVITGYISVFLRDRYVRYHCSIAVVVMLLTFCLCVDFSLVLCITIPNISCSWVCSYIGGRVRVLLTGVHSCNILNIVLGVINVCVIHVQLTFTDFVYV